MLFCEAPFLDRFALAAEAGFVAVEFLFPYAHGIEQIRSRLAEHGLAAVLFDVPPGDPAAGEVGTLCCPNRRDYFRRSLDTSLDAAARLSCERVNVLFGNRDPDLDPQAQIACAVENLRWAIPRARDAGVTLLIEPLNAVDCPSYFLHRSDQAIEIVKIIGDPQVRLQYDVYHAQMTEGNLMSTIAHCFPYIGHVQISDVPGRHEPGTGEINYPAVLARLAELDYRGYVGLEYNPLGGTSDSLRWLPVGSRGFA